MTKIRICLVSLLLAIAVVMFPTERAQGQGSRKVDLQVIASGDGVVPRTDNTVANLVVIVTDALTGQPVVSGLQQSDFTLITYSSGNGAPCGIGTGGLNNSVKFFGNPGTGAYVFTVAPSFSLPQPPGAQCYWVSGKYLLQIRLSGPVYFGQAGVVLEVPKR